MLIVFYTFIILIVLMAVNANLIKLYLDRKTKYKNIDVYDQEQILLLFLFFGIFTLPFIKQIKRYRKISYLKLRLQQLKEYPILLIVNNPLLTMDDINKEKFSIERYLKLRRLKRKS